MTKKDKRGRRSSPRLRPEASEKLRQLLSDMGITLRAAAREVGRRERWLHDAFARRDRDSGERLPLLESDAAEVLGMLDRRDWRRHRGLFGTFAELDATIRHNALARDEAHQTVINAVPLLIMDDAVEQFADEFLRYLKVRGIEAPRRKVFMDFFNRVPAPKAVRRFSYLELCAGMFELRAAERARRIRISADAFETYDEFERPVRITKALAIFPLLRKATPVEERRYRRRSLIRRRKAAGSN